MSNSATGNLVDEFEEAFQSCLEACTQDEAVNEVNKDEVKAEVDQTVAKFIDLARQMEAFFLQKRFLLSALKPELIVKEDINELRAELIRKEDLIKRHYEKITVWQNLLADLQGYPKSPATQQLSQQTSLQQSPVVNEAVVASSVPGSSGQIQVSHSQLQQQQQQQQQMSLQQQQHLTLQQQQQLTLHQQQLHQQIQQQQSQPGSMYMPQKSPYGSADGQSVQLQGPLAYLEKTASSIDGQR